MRNHKPVDPFELKKLSKLHPYRLLWTAFNRSIDFYGKISFQPISKQVSVLKPVHYIADAGESVVDTARSANNQDLVIRAVKSTEALNEPIVEIGSYRGVTTRNMALNTQRTIYAIDPYIGYGGWETDLATFNRRVNGLPNVRHIKETSGQACCQFRDKSLSLLFIDSVPDFSNIWFNFWTWGKLVKSEGLIAITTVDNKNYPGANLACRRIIGATDRYSLWGYCPGLAIVKKTR